MKLFNKVLIPVFLIVTIAVQAQLVPQNSRQNNYQKKTVIIKVRKEYKSICSERAIANRELQDILGEINISSLRKKFPDKAEPAARKNPQGIPYSDLSRIYELKYDADIPVGKVIEKFKKLNVIEYAEPKYVPTPFYTPNDPQVLNLYHLFKIKAFDAWNLEKGDTNIVIGITDTGVDIDHEDLMGNIKYNYLDPIDGIDNDFDGYTDNFRGWDLGEDDNIPQSNVNHHGVHVSGIAAGVTDNNTGIAGVGFKCKFLPVKISDAQGVLTDAYEGIVYAADHGCDIINCSWGGGERSEFGQDVITYATINQNALVIGAAGNNNKEMFFYPASYDYVLSVAGTDTSDQRFYVHQNFASSYSIKVDVSAPAKYLISTWNDNTYNTSTGTSMAAPVVAGAAAIVKARFPNYNAIQIGEQLKATADNIDSLNPGFTGKLGRGRINLHRALTETTSPSIVMTAKNIIDNNDNNFVSGDTLSVTGTFVNYLAPAGNVTVTMSSTNQYISIIDSTSDLGSFSTLESKSNSGDPFRVAILSNIPVNETILFKVKFSSGSYFGVEYFELNVNQDFININTNAISTTITSEGRLGFNSKGLGQGFIYKEANLIYESGLMIGTSVNKVSDVVRSYPPESDKDFLRVKKVKEVFTVPENDIYLTGKFNDLGAETAPLKVMITHHTYAFDSVGHRKYIIQKFDIKNNGADSLKNLYAGFYTDWDINNASVNEANADSVLKMGYIFSRETAGLHGGIKILNNNHGNVYSINNAPGGAVDISNGYETSEKYITLSTYHAAAGQSGADVSQVVSTGPFFIAPGDTAFAAFAILAGDNLNDLRTSSENAQQMYDAMFPVGVKEIAFIDDRFFIYPNPAGEEITVIFTSAVRQPVTISFSNPLGAIALQTKIESIAGKNFLKINTSSVENGLYFVSLLSSDKKIAQKLMVVH